MDYLRGDRHVDGVVVTATDRQGKRLGVRLLSGGKSHNYSSAGRRGSLSPIDQAREDLFHRHGPDCYIFVNETNRLEDLQVG